MGREGYGRGNGGENTRVGSNWTAWIHLCLLLVTWDSGRTSVFELFLSCAPPVADGRPLMWVNRPL